MASDTKITSRLTEKRRKWSAKMRRRRLLHPKRERAKDRKRYLRDRERIRARRGRYYLKHRAERIQKSVAWNRAHLQQRRVLRRSSYRKNKPKFLEQSRKWRTSNPGKRKETLQRYQTSLKGRLTRARHRRARADKLRAAGVIGPKRRRLAIHERKIEDIKL